MNMSDVVAVVETGSSSSRGRQPDHIYLVKIYRDDRSVIVAIGLTERSAIEQCRKLNELFAGELVTS